MHATHIAVTAAMAVCGLGALIAIYGRMPQLLGISFYLGLWVLIAAMIIALALTLVLAVCAAKKQARPFLKRAWLGLVNGAVALLFLMWFAAHAS